MGCWLVAQNDVYAPAATASRAVFQAAFPPAKQTEAIVFCKEEITEVRPFPGCQYVAYLSPFWFGELRLKKNGKLSDFQD